jgi:hypothetical protein
MPGDLPNAGPDATFGQTSPPMDAADAALLVGPADTFSALAPWLVLLACALLAR